MSFAVILLNNSCLEDLYTLNLRTYVGLDVIPKKSGAEVVALLEHIPKADIILTVDKIGQECTAEIIYRELERRQSHTPLIIFTNKKEFEEMGTVLSLDAELKEVVSGVAKLLHVTSKDMASQIVPDYFPMDIHYFSKLQKSSCEFFVQVKQDNKNDQYAKVLDADCIVDKNIINDFIARGVKELFIPSIFRLKFVNEFSKSLGDRLKDESLTVKQRMDVTQHAQDFVYTQFKSLMFEEEIINLAKASIDSLSQVVKEMPKLEELLKNLLNDPVSFQFKHCQLNTFVCTHVVQHMDWGSSEQSEKLAFVSFFHDILLTSDEQIRICSDEELEKTTMSKEQKELVRKHAYLASDLISKMPQVPFGGDTIIKEHHGNRNGIGLNPSFAANISPLAMVFLVAEEYACGLLASKNHDEIIGNLNKKFYRKPKYLSIVSSLEKLKK